MFIERFDGAIIEPQSFGHPMHDVVVEHRPFQSRAECASQVASASAELAADGDEAYRSCLHRFLLHTLKSNTGQADRSWRSLRYRFDRPSGRNPCNKNSAVESIK